jgi:hypothetical protein
MWLGAFAVLFALPAPTLALPRTLGMESELLPPRAGEGRDGGSGATVLSEVCT